MMNSVAMEWGKVNRFQDISIEGSPAGSSPSSISQALFSIRCPVLDRYYISLYGQQKWCKVWRIKHIYETAGTCKVWSKNYMKGVNKVEGSIFIMEARPL